MGWMWLGLLLSMAPVGAAAVTLERIELDPASAAAVRIHLSEAATPTTQTLVAAAGMPTRFVVDFAGTTLGRHAARSLDAAPDAVVQRVRSGQFTQSTARVVLELRTPVAVAVHVDGSTVTLAPAGAPTPHAAAPEPVAEAPTPAPTASPPTPPRSVEVTRPAPPPSSTTETAPHPAPPPAAPPQKVRPTEPPPQEVAPPAPPAQKAGPPDPPPPHDVARPATPASPAPPEVARPAPPTPPAASAPTTAKDDASTRTAKETLPPAASPPPPSETAASAPNDAPHDVASAAPVGPTAATPETTPAPSVAPAPPASAPTAPAPSHGAAATAPSTTFVGPASPIPPSAPESQRTMVVVDAGHGGRDPGAEGIGGIVEKDLVLTIARQLAAKLAVRLPVTAVLTRYDDSFVPLRERLPPPDGPPTIYVSLHANASSDPRPKGCEVYYGGDMLQSSRTDGESLRARRFGRIIAHTLRSRVGIVRGHARPGRFAVLRRNPAPAVLVELGYLTHADDAARLRDPAAQDRLTDALVEGIATFLHAGA